MQSSIERGPCRAGCNYQRPAFLWKVEQPSAASSSAFGRLIAIIDADFARGQPHTRRVPCRNTAASLRNDALDDPGGTRDVLAEIDALASPNDAPRKIIGRRRD